MIYELIMNFDLLGFVFVKISVGYVGKFIDKEFGEYEVSFFVQLNSLDGIFFFLVYDLEINFKGVMVGDFIYIVELILYYKSYFGDFINLC